MADKKSAASLGFPVKGFDENWAYKAQPEGTTPDCLNVRPYDVLGQRLRGGQRAGVSKYFPAQPNGTNPIQMLLQEPVPVSGFIETFTHPNGTVFDSIGAPWRHYEWSGAPWLATPAGGATPAAWVANTVYAVGDQVTESATLYVCTTANNDAVFTVGNWTVYVPLASPATVFGDAYRITNTQPSIPTAHVRTLPSANGDMTVSFTVTHVGAVDEACFVGVLFRASPTTGYVLYYGAATTFSQAFVQVYDETGALLLNGPLTSYPQPWAPAGAAPNQLNQNDPVRITVTTVASDLFIYLNGTLVGQIKGTVGNAGNALSGFVAYPSGTAGNIYDISGFSVSNVAPPLGQSSRILTCSGGALATGIGGGAWTPLGSVMNTTGIVRGVVVLGKVYLLDGTASHYQVYDPGPQTVLPWVPTAGALPVGDSDPTAACTIVARYRNRIVLSGLKTDPQNWFMSAVGNPLDWDYAPVTITATMAVAGNNSDAGLVGESITALAPVSDDLLVMGCQHSLWVLRGDPAAGGQIDALSHTVGIVGPDAWCVDPQGVMYFFGDGVFYRLAPNSAPEPISRGRMDRTFAAIDTALNTINLMWDELLHGVHIYVTPLTTGASTHFWWDVRTDSFWKEVYPNAVGPTATLVFQSPTSTARADLLGGQDGYVREISATAKTDDGTTILSRVKFAPTTPGDVHQNSRISRITTVLESTSDPVRVSLYAAQSPEEVVAATTPAWSYMVTPQVRYSIPRIQGNSLLLEMKNDSFSTAWVTGTNYVVGSQVVASDGLPYVSLTVHTSTTGGSHPTPPGNTTDWVVTTFRTWALESANVVLDLTGRTRHGRI